MIIHTNQISLTLPDAETAKKADVSVLYAKDGSVSHIYEGVTMEGPVQEKAGKGIGVYTEAEAKQLHIEETELPEDGNMSPADFISQCMTGEDAGDLSEEQTPLEEYTSSQLDRAIHRIKEERQERRGAVEDYVSREREQVETIEEAAIRNMVESGEISSLLLEPMKQSDLPMTPDNAMRLSRAMEMVAEIGSFTEASMKFFVANELTITPENISGSQYSMQGKLEEESVMADFSQVEQQVIELLSKDGVVPDEETMATAKWLYENNLPVTEETVCITKQLDKLKQTEEATICERIIDQMAEGICPEKANLMKWSVAEAITARRQLEEARLTMSIEALRSMSAQGVEPDILHLEEVVANLRLQEQQAKEAMLQETGLPVTKENADTMYNTLQAAKEVLSAPVEFLGFGKEQSVADTLRGLSEQAVIFTEQFDKAERGYEAVGTEVRRDLGDSLQKAFHNVDNILEDIGIEKNAANQRAVRSLAYNQMPLTEENIVSMKEYDKRITSLMKDMQPPVVAELIRRGINPLTVSLEELGESVAEIQQEVGTEDISFSRYLWKLEHQKAITSEEKESMIGIYRLFDKIEKSDGAAAGLLLKEGRELSLEALLSAVRTRRDAGIDVQVKDDFGSLEKLLTTKSSISQQIQTAYNKSQAKEFKQELSELSPKEENEYYGEIVKEIKETVSVSNERLQEFLTRLELPDTMANLQMAQAFLRKGGKNPFFSADAGEGEEILEAFEEPDKLEAVYERLEEKTEEKLAKMKEADDISYDSFRTMLMMGHHISFFGRMREYQMYEVPIVTEQGMATCRVTIQSGTVSDKGMVEIGINSPEFGNIQASFKVKGHHVKGFVTIENEERVATCQTVMRKFEKDLEENGFTMDSGSLIVGNRDSLHVGDRAEGTKNKDLYKIAKLFIVSVNRKDDEE